MILARYVGLAVISVLVTLDPLHGREPSPTTSTDPAETIGVGRLYVTAVDRAGAPVLDLRAEDFNIKEGGTACHVIRAALATEPARIALLVDNSDEAVGVLKPLRTGLQAFIDGTPVQDEIAILTFGRQIEVRTAPTTDRRRLRQVAASVSADYGSGTALIESLLQAHRQFTRGPGSHWPVFVIVTADHAEISRQKQTGFNAFVSELQQTQATVYAVLFSVDRGLLTATVTSDLVRNTRGLRLASSTAADLPMNLDAIARRISADQRRLAERYELDYSSPAIGRDAELEVGVVRDGVTLAASRQRLP
ncbi:MAG TPA: VWA domain-containing protein [Vicinamibacterales bacterium]|jgi:hypothetical protein|nr:VWA domain-containing protein [Vicinamibacterales bacterium]